MTISSSPTIGENVNLDAAKVKFVEEIAALEVQSKEATEVAIKAVTEDPIEQPVRYSNFVRAAIDLNRPEVQPGYNLLNHRLKLFSGTEIEICCPDTGFHVWGRSLEEAQVLWDKAVEKHKTINACCLNHANHREVLTNGAFPIAICNACGQRNVPMPIQE